MREFSEIVTTTSVMVDSVASDCWKSGRGGIKALRGTHIGVYIHWNFGSTFVPWSNVRYAKEIM